MFSGMWGGLHMLDQAFRKNVSIKARAIVTPKNFLPFFRIENSDKTTASIEITEAIMDVAPGPMLITVANRTKTIAAQPATTRTV